MKERRITINVSEKLHSDFKMMAVKNKTTMTNMLTSYIKEVTQKKSKGKKNE